MNRKKAKANIRRKLKIEARPVSKCIICGVDRLNMYGHVQRAHKLQIARYRELETDAARLEQYKKRHGFTNVVGQCGYCLVHFDSAKNLILLNHLKSCAKNPAINPSERKGFDMNLMRRLRNQGHFKNSMLAEIEEDERLDKINNDLDVMQENLEKMILDAEEEAAAMGVPVDLEAQLGRDLNRRCTMKQEYQET